MKTLIEKLASQANSDPYLKEILYKMEHRIASDLIGINGDRISDNEIIDSLRFADILSRSEKISNRNLSLKIISLLFELNKVKKDDYFKAVASSILVKLGNFPSIEVIDSEENILNISEIKFNYLAKSITQESPFGEPFTDPQFKVFNEMKERNHYSFSASTSFGKSFIFEAFTKYLIEQHNGVDNIAFIVPTKALINQISFKIKNILHDVNYKVVNSPEIPKIFLNKGSKFVFVFTAERLVKYLLNKKNPQIDYLFVDEAHKLLNYKDKRTPILYHALTLAKRKSINIYFASPNVPNPEVFLKLINNSTEESVTIEEIPVAQNRFFIDTTLNKGVMLSDFGEDIDLNNMGLIGNPIKDLKTLLQDITGKRQSIIYCNTVEKTIETAVSVSKEFEEVKCEEIDELIKFIEERVHSQYFLKMCLTKGIAYHFGGMPEELKIQVEDLYRKSKIKYIFCTSTLLEGVNLPAKNIFILSEKIGLSTMKKIDFWNLAGRAGRLTKDLSGNIFCVNLFNQEGYWANKESIEILRDKKIDEISPQIMSKSNGNLYKNITNYYLGKDYTNKKFSEDQKRIFQSYGNILMYHNLIDGDSILKDNYMNKEKKAVSILKELEKKMKVPKEIIAENVEIDLKTQNKIIVSDAVSLPMNTNYEDCLKVLEILCEKYRWKETESGGVKPMIYNKSQLSYYALLLESWINSKSLKYLIERTIKYFHNENNSKVISFYKQGEMHKEIFNMNNDIHINSLINTVISDLEGIIKYKVKSYVSNYQAILQAKGLEIRYDWEKYIDYGTTDSEIISVQNLGFSRNLSIFLQKNHKEIFKKDRNGVIFDVNNELIEKVIKESDRKNEYKELSILLDLE